MSIRFICANAECGRDVDAPDGTAGKKARCPYCGQVQTIPVVEQGGPDPFSAKGAPAAPARTSRARPARGGEAMQSCPVCGTVYPHGQACPHCRAHRKSYAHERRDVGKYVKIGIGLAVILGLMAGLAGLIVWQLSKPVDYMEKVVGTRHVAERAMIDYHLRQIYNALQRYAISDEDYPASREDLIRKTDISAGFLQSAGNPDDFLKYIPGQSSRSDPSNILLYDPYAGRDGMHVVLRTGGQIERLTKERLDTAIAETEQHLR